MCMAHLDDKIRLRNQEPCLDLVDTLVDDLQRFILGDALHVFPVHH